jgi:hypothetical protein
MKRAPTTPTTLKSQSSQSNSGGSHSSSNGHHPLHPNGIISINQEGDDEKEILWIEYTPSREPLIIREHGAPPIVAGRRNRNILIPPLDPTETLQVITNGSYSEYLDESTVSSRAINLIHSPSSPFFLHLTKCSPFSERWTFSC